MSHKSPLKIMLRKLSAPNIQRIKGICAITATLQQVLLRLGIFLGGLILSEAVASAFHTITKLQGFGHRCFFICIISAAAIPWISNRQPQNLLCPTADAETQIPDLSANAGGDATVSRPRRGCISAQIRSCLLPGPTHYFSLS